LSGHPTWPLIPAKRAQSPLQKLTVARGLRLRFAPGLGGLAGRARPPWIVSQPLIEPAGSTGGVAHP